MLLWILFVCSSIMMTLWYICVNGNVYGVSINGSLRTHVMRFVVTPIYLPETNQQLNWYCLHQIGISLNEWMNAAYIQFQSIKSVGPFFLLLHELHSIPGYYMTHSQYTEYFFPLFNRIECHRNNILQLVIPIECVFSVDLSASAKSTNEILSQLKRSIAWILHSLILLLSIYTSNSMVIHTNQMYFECSHMRACFFSSCVVIVGFLLMCNHFDVVQEAISYWRE